MSTEKTRLDLIVVEKGLAPSRQRARALIMARKVLVNNMPVDKPGTLIYRKDSVIIKEKDVSYVSRGGLKLEKALEALGIDIAGLYVLMWVHPQVDLRIVCCIMAQVVFMRWMSAMDSWHGN